MPKVPREPSLKRLKTLEPDTRQIANGVVVWRVYFRRDEHPTTWSDFRHVGPLDTRFDHHLVNERDEATHQERAVMYVADDPITCLAEVFQRTRVVNRWHNEPWLVGFEVAKTIGILDLTGSFPTRAGASMGLMTGARSVSRNWARGFYDVYPALAGLFYPSSMHANQPVMALTDRAEIAGVVPAHPSFHRALSDAAILTLLKNAARSLGYVLN